MTVWLYKQYGMFHGYGFCEEELYDSYDRARKRLEEEKENHAIGHDIIVNTSEMFVCKSDKDDYHVKCMIEEKEVI